MATRKSNFEAARSFVSFGLERRDSGERESASGPGSSLSAAGPALALIRRTLQNYDVKSLLDLGCGDWNWMKELKLPDAGCGLDVSYEGWDASPELIEELTRLYGRSGKIEFALKDITSAPLPKVDMIIARDVLFHLPVALSAPLVERIRESCRLFLSTTFLNEPSNADIETYLPIEDWGFYRINLNAPPFDLGQSMEEAVREPECTNKGQNRYACLYHFDSSSQTG